MNRYRANVFPCRTPATMSKKSLSLYGEQTFTFVVFIKHHNGCNGFFSSEGNRLKYLLLLPLCMESNTLEKSANKSIASRFFLYKFLLKFDGLSEFVVLWITFSENHFDSS